MLGLIAVMGIVTSGCSQRRGEAPEDDHTATCEAACATVHACASAPIDDTEAECVANCREPGEGVWQSLSCDTLADELLHCIADMSCEQYAVYESDLDNSACYEETLEYSICLSEESD